MFAFFENLVDPFPAAVPGKPPHSLFGFLWHYAKPIAPHLLFVSLSASAFAILEVALFEEGKHGFDPAGERSSSCLD